MTSKQKCENYWTWYKRRVEKQYKNATKKNKPYRKFQRNQTRNSYKVLMKSCKKTTRKNILYNVKNEEEFNKIMNKSQKGEKIPQW